MASATGTDPGSWAFYSRPKPHIAYYFAGSLLNQIGQACMAAAMPLATMMITKSTALGAASVTVAAACAALGQAAIVPLLSRVDLRLLLLCAMGTKTLLLLIISYLFTQSTKPWAPSIMGGLFCADSLIRGAIDSLRNVLPMLYLGTDQKQLSEFNSNFQVAIQLAVVLGPAFVGLTTQLHPAYAIYLVCTTYCAALFSYSMMPPIEYSGSSLDMALDRRSKKQQYGGGMFNMTDLRREFSVLSSPIVLVPFIALLTIQGQRLKGVLPSVFAKSLLQEPSGHSAGYIMAAQGAGGVLSALVSVRLPLQCCAARYWLAFAVIGMATRTWGWSLSMSLLDNQGLTANVAVLPYMAATFLYGYSSNAAQVAMSTLLQARAQSVGIIGAQRFLVRVSGVITKVWVTAIIAGFEIESKSRQSYEDAFMAISICLTILFIVPQILCFLHLHFFSGVGHESNYETPLMSPRGTVEDDETSFSDEDDDQVVAQAKARLLARLPNEKSYGTIALEELGSQNRGGRADSSNDLMMGF